MEIYYTSVIQAQKEAGVLEIDLPLDFLLQVLVRDQLVVLVPKGVLAWWVLDLHTYAQLSNHILDSECRLDSCANGSSILQRDTIRRYQLWFGGNSG